MTMAVPAEANLPRSAQRVSGASSLVAGCGFSGAPFLRRCSFIPSTPHAVLHNRNIFATRYNATLACRPFPSNQNPTLTPSRAPRSRLGPSWSCPSELRSALSVPADGRAGRLTSRAASGSSSSSEGRKESRWDPLLANSDVGCPVPPEQQPVNEYSDLSEAIFFSWASTGPFNLGVRLAAVGLFFTVAVGWPIASATFDPQKQALQCVLSAFGGGLFPVTLATVRLYLGWQYIGARLSSATVEYEETGWYDGQVWVKTPELLARDRLLASYRVKPVLKRLQSTLTGLGASLALIIGLVAFLPSYTPTPEPRPSFFDDIEVDSPYMVNIMRAEEKVYDPAAVDAYEGGEDEDADEEAAEGVESSVAELYRRLHSTPAMSSPRGSEEGASTSPSSSATLASYSAQGFGFEYFVDNGGDGYAAEAGEGALFSRPDARALA